MCAGLAGAVFGLSPAAAEPVAVLRVLEKGPARASVIEAPLNAVTRFGPLEIVPTRCWESLPEDLPESAAFLVITEPDPVGRHAGSEVFRGWMFASSPGLSALEYPTHDVWMLDCRERGRAGPGAGAAERSAGSRR